MAQVSHLSLHSPAKINLTLHVTGRDGAGYHLLHSLVAFTNFGDTIHLSPKTGSTNTLKFTGAGQQDIDPANNTVTQVIQAIDKFQNYDIHVEKRIPTQAGLGGGSSNAGALIKHAIEKNMLSESKAYELAARIGSDVPVCVRQTPCIMTGRGEILGPPLCLPRLYVVLVQPDFSLSTPDVYHHVNLDACTAPTVIPEEISCPTAFETFLSGGQNDLSPAATLANPRISEVLEEISSSTPAWYVQMTGSGSVCYGLYKSGEDAKKAGKALENSVKKRIFTTNTL